MESTPYNLRMPARERRTIFREMAKGELRRGPLTPKRQRGLVAYAARLGIHPNESAELIQEAARDLGLIVPAAAARRESIFASPVSMRMWVALSILLVVAGAYHFLFRYPW